MAYRVSASEALKEARDSFSLGHNCAQSVLGALQTCYGLPSDDLWLAAAGFGSGMGRRQLVCGAVSGAILACGLVTAAQRSVDRGNQVTAREETYARVREIIGRFEARFHSTECRTLLGCDLQTEEGQTYFRQNELLDRVCHEAVAFAIGTAIIVCGEPAVRS